MHLTQKDLFTQYDYGKKRKKKEEGRFEAPRRNCHLGPITIQVYRRDCFR